MDVQRRTVLKAGVWSTPVIAMAIAAPAASASPGTVPRAAFTAAFPGAVRQPGVQWVDLEVTNTSAVDALTPSVILAGGAVSQVTAPTGWSTTIGISGATIAGGVIIAGANVIFRVEFDVQPDAAGEVLQASVLDDGILLGQATLAVAPTESSQPGVVRSFGPNGTHWPPHTPWIGDAAAKVVVVDCTWTAIGAAIKLITDAEAAAGVHIKVRPGTLGGNGVSSGSTPVLRDVGKATWAKNVLVSPRDGWGTVKVTATAGARLRDVYGVTFARINATSILLTNCSRSVWAHSKVDVGFRITSSYNATTRQCDAYEVVMSDAKAGIADPLGYAAGADCSLIESVWDGCYCAPVFRPTGATDHVDSLQMYGSGWYRGLTVRDSTIFGSLNCALQIGGSGQNDPNLGSMFLTVDHSIITSQATAIRGRYTLPQGVDAPTIDQAINGVGEPGMLDARDSYIFGSMYRSTWRSVSNTRVSSTTAVQRNTVADGEWIYDATMNSWGASTFDELSPEPTEGYLASIWT